MTGTPMAVTTDRRLLRGERNRDFVLTHRLEPKYLEAAPQPLKDVADWLGSYQRFWDAGFDLLDERLRTPDNEARDG